MDPSSISAKKDRNQKRQRDKFHKKKPNESSEHKSSEAPESESLSNSGYNPQPQRANRRNEQQPPKPIQSTPSAPQENKDKGTESTNVVDHSHLKRETEEIAKLTKKFAKREVSSNWNRYSVSEMVENDESLKEPAPADFSDLLQMPTSRGGHLQLKEEQDWSAASGNELGSYFALDLKLLNLGLDCVPAYERLRLPKHMFTEEDIMSFDALADEAKKCYNSDNPYNGSEGFTEVLKECLTKVEEIQDPVLDLPKRNQAVNKKDEKSDKNVGYTTERHLTKDNIDLLENLESGKKDTVSVKIPKVSESESSLISSNNNPLSQNSLKLLDNKNIKPLEEKSCEYNPIFSKLSDKNKLELCEEKLSTAPIREINKPDTLINPKDIIYQDEDINFQVTNKMEDKVHKPEEIKTHPKSTFSEEICDKKEKSSMKKEESKDFNLINDDDDDLDFLLTLKSPVNQQHKKENKQTDIKDSSFLPGGVAETQINVQKDKSDLDDWLDSVLQD